MQVEVTARAIIEGQEYATGTIIDTTNPTSSMKALSDMFKRCVLTIHKEELEKTASNCSVENIAKVGDVLKIAYWDDILSGPESEMWTIKSIIDDNGIFIVMFEEKGDRRYGLTTDELLRMKI